MRPPLTAGAVRELLSPKQVARAIGVSESSLKRWCDRGLIPTERTAGGHRRLRLDAVVSFIRDGGYELQDPQLLGLPATTGQTEWTLQRAKERLRDALVAGDESVCRQIVLDVYLARHSVSVICDQLIAAAFHDIGDLWDCGDVEVYEERRACEISVKLIHELCHIVPHPQGNAPVAFGGTIDGDPYTLAVSMAELVLRDAGWNAASLGHMLPFATLRTAVETHRPKLLWLSISAIRDEARFVKEMHDLFTVTQSKGTALAVGGRSLSTDLRQQLRYSVFCDTLQNLADFARTLAPSTSSASTSSQPAT